jgi:hypothetical protein
VIDVQVSGGFLEVAVTEGDALLLTSSRDPWKLSIPLEHVSRAVPGKPLGFTSKKHVLDRHGGLLVCARRGEPTIEIYLDGQDQFKYLTLSVPDPEDTAATIKGALRQFGR